MNSDDADSGPRHLYSASLSDDYRFTIPSQLRPHICIDYSEDNPTDSSVFWYRETTQNLPVVANNKLTEANYETAEYLTYTLQKYFRLEIPKSIRKKCELVDDDGTPAVDTIFVVAVGNMLAGDTRSAFILTERKAWDLLPNPHPDSIDQGLADQVLNQAPGFLPTPR